MYGTKKAETDNGSKTVPCVAEAALIAEELARQIPAEWRYCIVDSDHRLLVWNEDGERSVLLYKDLGFAKKQGERYIKDTGVRTAGVCEIDVRTEGYYWCVQGLHSVILEETPQGGKVIEFEAVRRLVDYTPGPMEAGW